MSGKILCINMLVTFNLLIAETTSTVEALSRRGRKLLSRFFEILVHIQIMHVKYSQRP
jgi:hypothetical protein